MTQSSYAHDYVFLDLLLARVEVVEHNSVEWSQEHFLVAEVLSFFFLKELVC